MYPYPLTSESMVIIPLPQAPELQIRAWELRLREGAISGEEPGVFDSYKVLDDVGPGVFALIWDGSASFSFRGTDSTAEFGEGGVGVAFLDQVAEIRRGANAKEARVAVVGVFAQDEPIPDLKLLERGTCNGQTPSMSGGVQYMTLILRRLDFGDAGSNPTEIWSRPGYFLSTIGGPTGGPQCEDGEDDPTEGELDIVALPQDQTISLDPGTGTGRIAYILDFHAEGDVAEPRDPITEPGCQIRCWGP